MTRKFMLTIGAVMVACGARKASAGLVGADLVPPMRGVVFDQRPLPQGGPVSGSDSTDRIDTRRQRQVADNVRLDSSATIRKLRWWGFYGGSGAPGWKPRASEAMRIRFYGARSSDKLPDDNNILFEEIAENPLRTAIGDIAQPGGLPMQFAFELELYSPVSLAADTPYWLEVVQIGDARTPFRWDEGIDLEQGLAFRTEGPSTGAMSDWQSSAGSLAFQLSTVPEPSTGLLCTFALLLMGMRRTGRGRRTRR